jgi:hypothetical protein
VANAADVAKVALSLPGTVEIESEGFDFRVGGKGFVWSYPERRQGRPRVIRTDVAVLFVGDEAEKQALLKGSRSCSSPLPATTAGRWSCCASRRSPSGGCGSWSLTPGRCGAGQPALTGPTPATVDPDEQAGARRQAGAPNSTESVSTVPPCRPGAVWYFQYRFVWAMTLSGGGEPHSVWSSVVWASLTNVAS